MQLSFRKIRITTTTINHKGFTLVELIVVMVLIAIVSALGIPRFFDRSQSDQLGLFTDTLAALRYAQKRAVATRCPIRVTITMNTEYILHQDANCGSGAPNFNVNVRNPGTSNANYQQTNFASTGVGLSSDVSPLLFDGLGRATNTSNTISDITITVGSDTISVVGQTGLVCGPAGANGCPIL